MVNQKTPVRDDNYKNLRSIVSNNKGFHFVLRYHNGSGIAFKKPGMAHHMRL